MKEHPIIFSGPMVRAILAGQKTQTRRIVKLPRWAEPTDDENEFEIDWSPTAKSDRPFAISKRSGCSVEIPPPHGEIGDRLWVRETFGIGDNGGLLVDPCLTYKVDGHQKPLFPNEMSKTQVAQLLRAGRKGWRSGRFMSRWASRITLEVTGVRREQVQDISEADATAEGAFYASESDKQQAARVGISEGAASVGVRDYFRQTWDTQNAKRGHGWDANDDVWVYELKRAGVDV